VNGAHGRISKLERLAAEGARCRLCGGVGRNSLRVHLMGQPEPPPRGCAGCGKVKSVRWIRVEYVEEA
jgi:hypothetical protein